MADDIVVATPEQTVTVPLHDDENGTEVDAAWLTSTFAVVQEELRALATTLTTVTEAQRTGMTMLEALDNKLPANLTVMLTQQQETITALTQQLTQLSTQMITSSLTQNQEPSTETVTTTEGNAEEEVTPVSNVEPEEHVTVEVTKPKRRKI